MGTILFDMIWLYLYNMNLKDFKNQDLQRMGLGTMCKDETVTSYRTDNLTVYQVKVFSLYHNGFLLPNDIF